jgi:ATP-dependent Clp protease protease subunit
MKNYLENSDGSRIDFNDISLESFGSHMFFGEVDNDTTSSAVEFILKANQIFPDRRDLTLYINSVGGDVAGGFGLIDIMQVSKLPIRTVGLGNIMSMGVLMLCAGAKGKRYMTKNTQVMAHQFSDHTDGKFHEIISVYKAELYMEQQFLHHFKTFTNLKDKQIKDILFGPSDRWLSPSECKKFGIVDHVVDELPHFNLELPAPVTSRKSMPRSQK